MSLHNVLFKIKILFEVQCSSPIIHSNVTNLTNHITIQWHIPVELTYTVMGLNATVLLFLLCATSFSSLSLNTLQFIAIMKPYHLRYAKSLKISTLFCLSMWGCVCACLHRNSVFEKQKFTHTYTHTVSVLILFCRESNYFSGLLGCFEKASTRTHALTVFEILWRPYSLVAH